MSFIQDFQSLRKSIPFPSIRSSFNENCHYCEYGGGCKDCWYCYTGIQLQNSLYCDLSGVSQNLVDCDFCTFSQLCYECVNSAYCFQSTYLFDCTKCQNCHFCSMCVDCSDCFGCVALTRKKYCIFNKQFSKDDYERELQKLKTTRPGDNLKRLKELITRTPIPQSIQRNNVNCPYGDYISYSKDSYWCFNTYYSEDSGYVYNSGIIKNCWDTDYIGGGDLNDFTKGNCELCYECSGCGSLYHCAYLNQSAHCQSCYYGWDLDNCSDCFGCVSLSHKKYCVLNNQLTKERYEEAVRTIKKELGWS